MCIYVKVFYVHVHEQSLHKMLRKAKQNNTSPESWLPRVGFEPLTLHSLSDALPTMYMYMEKGVLKPSKQWTAVSSWLALIYFVRKYAFERPMYSTFCLQVCVYISLSLYKFRCTH